MTTKEEVYTLVNNINKATGCENSNKQFFIDSCNGGLRLDFGEHHGESEMVSPRMSKKDLLVWMFAYLNGYFFAIHKKVGS